MNTKIEERLQNDNILSLLKGLSDPKDLMAQKSNLEQKIMGEVGNVHSVIRETAEGAKGSVGDIIDQSVEKIDEAAPPTESKK